MKTKLLIGAIALSSLMFTACGSSGSSGGSESSGSSSSPNIHSDSYVPPASNTPPIGENGNIKLLPGYEYECFRVDRYEFYVSKGGYITFDGDTGKMFFDSNYNGIGYTSEPTGHGEYSYSVGPFEPGQYYMETSFCGFDGEGDGWFTVESDILY